MPRYFINEDNLSKNLIDGENYHHIAVVQRAKINDVIELSCNDITYSAKITDITKEIIKFEVIDQFYFDTEFNFNITLMQCYPKGDKLDDIIKHSTELGVTNILPVMSNRSIVKLDDKKKVEKVKRFNLIAKEAAKQSRRNKIPTVLDIVNLKNVDYTKFNIKIFAYEKEATNTLNKSFLNIINSIKEFDEVIIAIGPEGGFSTDEADFLIDKGFVPVSLGKRILRTETAGLYCLSAIGAIKE